MRYDYLIVGSGLFGTTFAYEMKKLGKKCLVLEKRSHIGGNCYTENRDGINFHLYGPHIFHTNDKNIWDWVNQFCEFNTYRHSAKVVHKDKTYSFPINLLTLNQMWGIKTPSEAIDKLDSLKSKKVGDNLEDWVLSMVGEEIYEIFIKGYTSKQWGKDPKLLPSSIIKRLPIRTNFDDNYFFDKYQGIPIGGYTQIFEKALDGIEVITDTDFFNDRNKWESMASKIVFTGKIDEFFDYKFGELEYRSLKFESEKIDVKDYQGCALINYTEYEVPFTRICEHKHFENSESDCTWITKEFPKKYEKGDTPYYPINDESNSGLYKKYKDLAKERDDVIFGGRLAEYRYYDMHQIIGSALSKVRKEIENFSK